MHQEQEWSSPCFPSGVAWVVPSCSWIPGSVGGSWSCHTRLPGQDTTVRVTLFLCSFSIGINSELLIPIAGTPFTATISSPHLPKDRIQSGLGSVLTLHPSHPEPKHQLLLERTFPLESEGREKENTAGAWVTAVRVRQQGRNCAGQTLLAQVSPAAPGTELCCHHQSCERALPLSGTPSPF